MVVVSSCQSKSATPTSSFGWTGSSSVPAMSSPVVAVSRLPSWAAMTSCSVSGESTFRSTSEAGYFQLMSAAMYACEEPQGLRQALRDRSSSIAQRVRTRS